MNNTPDITFHYPPELFNLLVDTIPLLNRSKKDVITFFRGAGVTDNILSDLAQRVISSRQEINKYEIVRTVLERLNAKGEGALRERREVLRRVVEFTNFDTCWPNDQLKVKGLVSSIREVVNQKDSFTRMKLEREEERKERLFQANKAVREKQERVKKIENAKKEFYSLFASNLSPQARGKKLEAALNNLFRAYGILVQEAFHLVGEGAEGIIEQIDGVIEVKGILHFVEMKWYKSPVGKAEISEHLVRLMSRAEVRGIFISASDYTEPAISVSKEMLQHKNIVLIHLQEIVHLLEHQEDLVEFLLKKNNAAQIYKNPYLRVFEVEKGQTG